MTAAAYSDLTVRPYRLYFRNPLTYSKQLVALGEFNVAFELGYAVDNPRFDPVRWAELNFGNVNWRILVFGYHTASEYAPGCKNVKDPKYVYPSWEPTMPWDNLVDFVENPWGNNWDYCNNPRNKPWHRPKYGQPHKVFVNRMGFHTKIDKHRMVSLSNLQVRHPECEIIVCGTTSYSALFDLGFTAAVYDGKIRGAAGQLVLPNGALIPNGRAREFASELRATGWEPEDLEYSYDKILYNLLSVRLASIAWKEQTSLLKRKPLNWRANIHTPVLKAEDLPLRKTDIFIPRAKRKPGDMLSCNHCSVWRMCNKYQEGSVCGVSGSEGKRLAKFFGTKSSADIVDGLSRIMEMRAERLEDAVEEERLSGETNKAIEGMMSGLFRDGATLAKLIDPELRTPLVKNIFNGIGGKDQPKALDSANTRALASNIILEIEASGIPRDQITEQVIDAYMRKQFGITQQLPEGERDNEPVHDAEIVELDEHRPRA